MRRSGRALVVGAGHNGLVCAALLAAAGMRVTVLEQAPAPGGCVWSAEDTLPGFLHDRCAGFFPFTRVSPVFRSLALERDGVEWIEPEVAMAHPFADGTAIQLCRHLQATVASLEAASPGAGRGWQRLMELLLPHRELLIRAGLEPFPAVLPTAILAARLRRAGVELARQLVGSAAAIGQELMGSERAAAWLSGSASHSDLGPDASGTAAIALMLNLLGQWVGWPFPRGGARRLTEALVQRVESLGGEVRCGARVAHVLHRGRRAVGVALENGEEARGEATVLTLSAGQFAAMVEPQALGARVSERLGRWRYGLGTLKVDFALCAPAPWSAPEARAAGVVHLGGELPELLESAHQAALGRVSPALPLVVGQHSLFDPTRAPDGRHTLYAYARIASDHGLSDDALARLVEDRIELFAPGFRSLVRGRAVRSPARLEHENPSLVGGDLGGGSMALDQELLFRPAPELARGRTPMRNLYVAGASVHPGPAVHGASGAQAARAVIGDAAPWRLWRG